MSLESNADARGRLDDALNDAIALAVEDVDGIAEAALRVARSFLEAPHLMSTDAGGIHTLFAAVSEAMFAVLAGPWALLVGAALFANLVQFKPSFSFEVVRPKLSRFSPASGIKKIMSPNSVMELAKGMIKVGVIAAVVAMLIWPERVVLTQLMTIGTIELLHVLERLILLLLLGVTAALGVIAIIDLIYQRRRHSKQLRMSKTDVKDETKQSEGDPIVKARIRSIRLERARTRMMAAVPDADVVVTNPTHYAVALKYDSENMAAPKLVAKGMNELALRIRGLAEEHDIPIVENPPVAQALYASVELDEEIPVEQYKAVAEIISYVMRLRAGRSTTPTRGSAVG